MPVAVLGLAQGAALTRFVRSAVLDVIRLDYINTARAKGLAERITIIKHGVRNALIPVVTLVALQIPTIFTGAVITEQIFRVPGHRLAADQRDPGQRHPGDHGHHLRVLLPGGDLQPDRRPALRLARSPDHLPLTMARALPSESLAPDVGRRAVPPATSLWREALAPLSAAPAGHDGRASSSLTMVTAVAVGPFVYRVPIDEIDFKAKLQGPSRAHPLGTDDLGQDLLARMLYGGRISLAVGVTAMLIALTIGVVGRRRRRALRRGGGPQR